MVQKVKDLLKTQPERRAGVYLFTFPAGPRTEPGPTSERVSPTSSGRAEEPEEPEAERGDDSLTDDREEEDARSSCFSREDGCDTGESRVKVTFKNIIMQKESVSAFSLRPAAKKGGHAPRMRPPPKTFPRA